MAMLVEDSLYLGTNLTKHYENKPIQIYWKFYHQKKKISDKNSDFFF